jgi:hypothetical protein
MDFLSGRGREYREGKVIRLVDEAGDAGVIEGFHFKNCRVKGPAVLLMQDKSGLIDNEFDGDPESILWEIPPDRERVVGAILVKNSTFEDCAFVNVGLAGPSEFVLRMRHDLEAGRTKNLA